MAYTPNVPQGSQSFAFTQPLIQGNFGFIQTDAQTEHQFNGNVGGVTEGCHLKASMPNFSALGGPADPAALPAGTNGMYYVSNGGARFFDGTNISRLTEASTASIGYQWIGRMLIQFGFTTSTTSGSFVSKKAAGTVTYAIPFPTGARSISTNLFYGTVAPDGAGTVGISSGNNASSFPWTFNSDSTKYIGFYWMAIGF